MAPRGKNQATDRQVIPDDLLDQLLGGYSTPSDRTGPDGLLTELRRRLIERAAGAELTHHLGYDDGEAPPVTQPNRRNGTTTKTLRTVDGPAPSASGSRGHGPCLLAHPWLRSFGWPALRSTDGRVSRSVEASRGTSICTATTIDASC